MDWDSSRERTIDMDSQKFGTFISELRKERDAIDPTENWPCLPPQRKSQSRAEAALLPAPGEDPWTQDVGAEPEVGKVSFRLGQWHHAPLQH